VLPAEGDQDENPNHHCYETENKALLGVVYLHKGAYDATKTESTGQDEQV